MFDENFLERHPLSVAYLQGVFKIRIQKVLKEMDVPDDIKAELIESAMNNKRLLEVLDENPGILFEIFDEQKIHFFIYPYKVAGEARYSYSNVYEASAMDRAPLYDTRKEAEKRAVRECFEQLEALLFSKNRVSHGDTV